MKRGPTTNDLRCVVVCNPFFSRITAGQRGGAELLHLEHLIHVKSFMIESFVPNPAPKSATQTPAL